MIPSFDTDNVGNEEFFPEPITWAGRIFVLLMFVTVPLAVVLAAGLLALILGI